MRRDSSLFGMFRSTLGGRPQPVVPSASIDGGAPWLRLLTPAAPAAPVRRPPPAARRAKREARIVSVGGGKGGVGKSLVAASLGIELARRGSRVVLVDCDLGGANLHTCLGVAPPSRTLSDFVNRDVERIEEVAVDTGFPDVSLVSGALDRLDAANPNHGQKTRLIRHIQTMAADFIVLDLAAGTQKNTLDFFLLADHKIVVLVPEPSAVENAHRFVKASFWRRLRTASTIFGVAHVLDEILEADRLQHPADVLDALEAADPETGRQLRDQMAAFRPGLVVNQVRTPADVDLGPAGATAWRRVFGVDMGFLGAVDHDEEVWRAARERRPLLRARSPGRAARALARIAGGICEADAGGGLP
jgi:flagellar biosynthesis protein FlhG